MNDFTPSPKKQVLDFLRQPGFEPLRQHDLAKALDLPRPRLRETLRALEEEGLAVRLRKNRWGPAGDAGQVVGRLRVHVDGFGFVTPERPGHPDVYISAESLGPAMDSDRVVVTVDSRASERGPSGRVLKVLERGHACVVGRLCRTAYYWYIIPDHPRLRANIRINETAPPGLVLREDHKVVVALEEQRRPGQDLKGRVVEDLGPADTPGVDILSIARQHDIPDAFAEDALRQAREAPALPEDLAGREDLRGQVIFTIDPEDARDFDDAVSLTREPDGSWQLGVHIADVAHYVAPDSPVDIEARRRGTSVYLVDRVIPMLPPRLTTEVCSLQPGRDRLTHSVFVRLDAEGRVSSSRTARSVIRSAVRLTYHQVQAWMDGKAGEELPVSVTDALGAMRELARRLRHRRMEAGSLDLNLPEIRCLLDEDGRPVALRKEGANESYQLIEEFMLTANVAVAQKIHHRGWPGLYRVHEEPDDEQWKQMRAELQALGLAGLPVDAGHLNRLARRARETPMAYSAHLAILRNLKRARYAAQAGLHFGLAFGCYTHFTSPIRRYPDLIAHRVLCAMEDHGSPPYSAEDMERLAEHCSRTETAAAEAEAESVDLKRIEYYRTLIDLGEVGPFDGVVTGVNARGLHIELMDSLQRGFLPFSALPEDRYVVEENRLRATGRRRRSAWGVGQVLKLQLARVDERRRVVSLALWTESMPGVHRRKKGPRRGPTTADYRMR